MDNPIIIISIIAAIIILASIFLFVFLKKKKNNTQYNEKITKIINELGGNDNIISATSKMSRIEFVLKDYELVNKDELKNLGIQGISKTSQKITLVVGNELAEDLDKAFKRS
jgi:phosphotransferase system IIB component